MEFLILNNFKMTNFGFRPRFFDFEAKVRLPRDRVKKCIVHQNSFKTQSVLLFISFFFSKTFYIPKTRLILDGY